MYKTISPPIGTVSLPHPGRLLAIEPLDYSNPYDHHALHRHDYFEIIFAKEGSGRQLIDFSILPIGKKQVFSIYPGQVHLMWRETTTGLLIQFRKDIFEYMYPLRHHFMYASSPCFNFSEAEFDHLYSIAESIQMLLKKEELGTLSAHKAYKYLGIILISLIEKGEEKVKFEHRTIITEFLSLMTEHIAVKKKVSEYCSLMGCHPDKLNLSCRETLGKTALQLIHEEILLEIKRLIILGQLSLKEIAFRLNFDSQANFSAFIKMRTGLTPSALKADLVLG